VNAAIVESSAIDRVCAGIADEGYAVVPDFLPMTTAVALAADARQRDAAGGFSAAGIGRGAARDAQSEIRGDRILWLDQTNADAELHPCWQALDTLRTTLNQTLLLGLFSFEGHYAIYPPGGVYRRHRDRFRDDDARVLSCVLYLNEDWSTQDGGALRIHFDGGGRRDVLPCEGTLVCFLSDRFEHEVLPATRERLALTGWFRRRSMPV
jgi:SM-20-related protein